MSEFLLESGFFGRLSIAIHRTKERCGGGARLHGSADSIRIHWDENEWLASEAGHMYVFMPIVYLGSGIVWPQAPPLRTIYVDYRLGSTTLRRRSSCGVSFLSTGSDLWTATLVLIIRSDRISPQPLGGPAMYAYACMCTAHFGRRYFHRFVFLAIHTVHIRPDFCSCLSGTRAGGPQPCGVEVSVGLLHPSGTERRMGSVWCAFKEGTVIRSTVSLRCPA